MDAPLRAPRLGRWILLSPIGLLAAAAGLVLWNGISKPIVLAADSPECDATAVVKLSFPMLHPIAGEVEAVVDVYARPAHRLLFRHSLGSYPSVRAAISDFRSVEWPEPGRIEFRGAGGTISTRVTLPSAPAGEIR